jgi:hypothetical protein
MPKQITKLFQVLARKTADGRACRLAIDLPVLRQKR